MKVSRNKMERPGIAILIFVILTFATACKRVIPGCPVSGAAPRANVY